MVKCLHLVKYPEFPRQKLVGELHTLLLFPYYLHSHLGEINSSLDYIYNWY